jgi:hypothetical protein
MTDSPQPQPIPPIIDDQGRRFLAEHPLPELHCVPLMACELLELSRRWSLAAAENATTPQAALTRGGAWRFAEERSHIYLRLARELDPTLDTRSEPTPGPLGTA